MRGSWRNPRLCYYPISATNEKKPAHVWIEAACNYFRRLSLNPLRLAGLRGTVNGMDDL